MKNNHFLIINIKNILFLDLSEIVEYQCSMERTRFAGLLLIGRLLMIALAMLMAFAWIFSFIQLNPSQALQREFYPSDNFTGRIESVIVSEEDALEQSNDISTHTISEWDKNLDIFDLPRWIMPSLFFAEFMTAVLTILLPLIFERFLSSLTSSNYFFGNRPRWWINIAALWLGLLVVLKVSSLSLVLYFDRLMAFEDLPINGVAFFVYQNSEVLPLLSLAVGLGFIARLLRFGQTYEEDSKATI